MTERADAYARVDAAIAAVESDDALIRELEDRLNDARDKTFAEVMPVENWLLGPASELFGRITLSGRPPRPLPHPLRLHGGISR